MPEKLALREEFPPVPKEQWEAEITADLKGADYEKKLVWRTEDGIAVRPYYTRGDAAAPDLAPGEYPFLRGAGQAWHMVKPGEEPAASVDASRHHEAGATAAQEIACALAEGVEKLAAGANPAEVTFAFSIGASYYLEVAKLRAARALWAQVVKAFGFPEQQAYMTIHARTALANKTLYDPYNNLLRATVEAHAAVTGGADSLTVRAFGYDQRLADNVQLVLKEESHLDKVADPAGGSWYFEALTDALAREAWELFQMIEAKGGFAAATNDGTIANAIARSRAAKEAAVATRKQAVIGTNQYPNLKETAAEAPAGDGWRAAQAFEALRRRTERAPNKPKVLLLEAGDAKMRKARAGFCAGFFATAAFTVKTAAALEEADLVVLCSSDAEYPALAAEIVPKTKAPVLVAGYPKESIDALKQAGVADFVYLGANAVEVLSRWQDKLGLPE
ncbi:MAG: methylmalonyl-CoA mutase family protein [Bryobacter sp.]|nr:methylmalonyl-CoA mutase family protein [Bryobacter sp.]